VILPGPDPVHAGTVERLGCGRTACVQPHRPQPERGAGRALSRLPPGGSRAGRDRRTCPRRRQAAPAFAVEASRHRG